MKKILLSLLMAAAATSAMADDYKYLTVETSSTTKEVELAKILKITFDVPASLVVVTTSEGQLTFPQKDMQKMFFTVEATAIQQLPGKTKGLALRGTTLQAKGNGMLRIYDASGALQRMANIEGEASISLRNLPTGVYIVNLGDETIKVKR